MLSFNWDAITLDDISRLVTDRTIENAQLDFKASVNIGSDDGKLELIEDIVAFANASGGDLLIGIPEEVDANGRKTGYPAQPVGIDLANPDHFRLSIENALRDRVEPRLVGVVCKFLVLSDGKYIVLIRVPNSFSFHLIRKQSWFKCVSRNQAGKYQLDATQIREGLLMADSVSQRMSNFRNERIAKILANETPVTVEDIGKVVVHVLPVQGFAGRSALLTDFATRTNPGLQGVFSSLLSSTHNSDGRLFWSNLGGKSAVAYAQVFRNGAFEGLETGIGGPNPSLGLPTFHACIDGYIVNGIYRYCQFLRHLGVAPPVYVGVSILGAKGYRIHRKHGNTSNEIDRDALILPDMEIGRLDMTCNEIAAIFRPTADHLFQALGYERSWNFGQDGTYLHRLGEDYINENR